MKNLHVISIVLGLLMCLHSAHAHDYVYLRTLTKQTFQTTVLDSKSVWLVYFYDSPSNHESSLAQLQYAAQALRGIFRVGFANVQDFSDEAFETGKLYYFGDDKQTPILYTGANDYEEIVKFLLSNTKELVDARSRAARQLKENQEFLQREAERAKKQSDDEAKLREKSDTILFTTATIRETMLKSREPYVINYYVANCSACIEFNKQWQLVSSALKGKIKIAKVNVTENEDLEQLFKLQSYPVVRFYPGGVKKADQIIEFGGVKKKTHILQWITKNDQQKTSNDLEVLTASDYAAACKQGKGTCVIFFVQNKDDSTLAELSSLPKNYLKKPISFFYVEKGSQDQFAKQFGIESYPNVLMTYCQRKTFWRLDHFDAKKIEDAVGEVMLGNRNNFVKYKFEQKLI